MRNRKVTKIMTDASTLLQEIKTMESKSFRNNTVQQSGYTQEDTHSDEYIGVGAAWYNRCDIFAIVGTEHDGTLCPITDEHLKYFAEESDKGFFSAYQGD